MSFRIRCMYMKKTYIYMRTIYVYMRNTHIYMRKHIYTREYKYAFLREHLFVHTHTHIIQRIREDMTLVFRNQKLEVALGPTNWQELVGPRATSNF